ncbi:MAG: YdcF family protein [Pseudomonadota bacterium]
MGVKAVPYYFFVGEGNTNRGLSIDLEKENKKAFDYIKRNQAQTGQLPPLYIVPGFGPLSDEPQPIHSITKSRLKSAVARLFDDPSAVLILSGGNVKPVNTPYNEAMEMKRHLRKFHNIPESRILVEPNAQNSVTNLRNVGRLMLELGYEEATIVTSFVQNMYMAFATASGFDSRSQSMLGYEVGEVVFSGLKTSVFRPSKDVVKKSESPRDP